MKRMVLIYGNGVVDTIDLSPTQEPKIEKMHRADMVIEIDLTTGITHITKNRWGHTGGVAHD